MANNQRTSSFEYQGISSEWKYELTDPVANLLGSALYGELELAPNVTSIEGKLIFDKRIGIFLVATNWIAEYEWIKESPETKEELKLEATLSAGYFVKPTVMFGAEVPSVTEIEREEGLAKWERTIFYCGPLFAYASKSWWTVISFMPQFGGPQKGEPTTLDLKHNERFLSRVLVGFHL